MCCLEFGAGVANGTIERDRLRTDALEGREDPGNAEREASLEPGD